MLINNKRDYTRLRLSGRAGNTLRVWQSVDEAIASGYTGRVGLRSGRRSGGVMRALGLYDMPVTDAPARLAALDDVDAGEFEVWERAQDDLITLGGEVSIIGGRWWLFGTHMQTNLAVGLADPSSFHLFGLRARTYLSYYMDTPSMDFVESVLYEYGTDVRAPVIEFHCFRRGVGVLGWNTVVWEIRHY